MEARINSFPVYVSGQYLTSENLNAAQSFLWQEEKITRYILCGNGIVHGLNTAFTDTVSLKQVNITKGTASTNDGYVIQTNDDTFDKGLLIDMSWITLADGSQQLMEKIQFDKVKDSLGDITEIVLKDCIEIFSVSVDTNDVPVGTNTLASFAITASQATSNYITLAWVYVHDEENDNCVQGDCNTKGILRNFTTRFFLVQNSFFPILNTINSQVPLTMAARIKNLSNSGSATGFYQASLTAWKANINTLMPYFSNSASGKQLSIISDLLNDDAKNAFTAAVSKFSIIASSADKNCQQYNNSFASDLSTAVNELLLFYNDYVAKYPVIFSTRIEGVIILGSFMQANIDKWRYYFLPAEDQDPYIFDRQLLQKLFMRAMALVNNFILQSDFKKQAAKVGKVIATPSLIGDNTLAHRAIPYYYDVLSNDTANEILNTWNPLGNNLQNIFCYYDSIIPGRADMVAKLSVADWTNENFFRIEGHVGLAKQDAINAINTLIVNDGLPFQLLDCDVDYKGPLTWNNWYLEFSDFLNSSLTKLKATSNSSNYTYDPFKKITTTNIETSYRKPDEIKSIMNDLTAYSGVFYNAANVQGIKATTSLKTKSTVSKKAATKETLRKTVSKPQVTTAKTLASGITAKSPLNEDVITNYINIVPQESIAKLVAGYNKAIIDVTDPKTKKLIVLKDLAGLEYLGGVPRGGTFVLLHSGGTVIGDGCLSGYYRIDQGRIFDL
ncbi:MAG: hypothetical protein JST21_01070 [Bacteroidetes bacterium]|nr:hypothetical protein [Bacteroidota bacterium]